jgi:hypothetical protein
VSRQAGIHEAMPYVCLWVICIPAGWLHAVSIWGQREPRREGREGGRQGGREGGREGQRADASHQPAGLAVAHLAIRLPAVQT